MAAPCAMKCKQIERTPQRVTVRLVEKMGWIMTLLSGEERLTLAVNVRC